MRPGRGRPGRRRGLALVAVAIATMPVGLVGAAAAGPTPSPTSPTLPLTVTLDRLTPVAPQPGDTIRITGTLHNISTTPVQGLTVHLARSSAKVGSRGEFDSYADTADGPPPAGAIDIPTATVTLARPELGVSASESFSVSVPVDDLHLPEAWQVYELALTVTGLTPIGETTLGQLRTFLPWAPVGLPGSGLPTRLAWVWPLADRPHRPADSVWTDDALAPQLGSAGRLGGLVAAGAAAEAQHNPPPPRPKRHKGHKKPPPPPAKPARPDINPVPVTWAVDPMLVEDAGLMSRGYKVGVGHDQKPGTGRTAAGDWLTALRAAAARGEVLALPYADPDMVAATRFGPALATQVQVATRAGQGLLSRALGTTPLPYAWPPDGLVDQRTLDTLFAGGITTVLLDSQALPVTGGEPSETPGAHTIVSSRDGNLHAILADHTLTDAVQAGTAPGAGALAVQRTLSELLMIQAERPSDQRSIVIAPDRRWAPSPSYAAALLADSGRVPWIEPVTLSEVVEGPTYDVQREPLTYPASERAVQLSRAYLDGVAAIKRQIDAFAGILPPGNSQARAFDEGILRLLSSAWRVNPAVALQHRAALAAAVARTMHRVRIASHADSLVTLTSHSGTVPVTITNELDTPVRIVVGIASQHLQVKGGRIARTIAPHRQVPVDVRATALTSGVFPLTVTLYTPTGQRYGTSVKLLVRSTAYGATALLITGGATAVLLLMVAIRLARRARIARAAARGTA